MAAQRGTGGTSLDFGGLVLVFDEVLQNVLVATLVTFFVHPVHVYLSASSLCDLQVIRWFWHLTIVDAAFHISLGDCPARLN